MKPVDSVVPDCRILFLLNSLKIGGSERKIVQLANALTAHGHAVVLAYLNGPETLLTELFPGIKAVHLHRKGKFSLGSLRRLRDAIEEHRIDVVVSINLYSTLYAGLLARFSRGRSHLRYFASINTTDIGSNKVRRQMLLYRPILHGMDVLIFGADDQRKLWLRNHLGRDAPESCVLYNGVDTSYFCREMTPTWRLQGWPAQRRVIGSVGMLRPEKSHDHLLHAVAELHRRGFDVGVVIVGGGDEEPRLRGLIVELGIEDRAHLSGPIRDVRPYLAGFDLFALTSTAVETFSNAVLEAMAMGCPVVASRIGGMPEMLKSGGGLTYTPGNIPELVEALQTLLSNDQLRTDLAEQARNIVVQQFSLEAMVDSFRNLVSIR